MVNLVTVIINCNNGAIRQSLDKAFDISPSVGNEVLLPNVLF
jgi:hypothetical protein